MNQLKNGNERPTVEEFESQCMIKMRSKAASRGAVKKGWLTSLTILCSIIIVVTNLPGASAIRMVRLCIASVDPAKLSSQCVMCNRREFPLTAIGCTGIDRMNDLIANPLSVHQALCLINNCRKVRLKHDSRSELSKFMMTLTLNECSKFRM